MAAGRGLDVEIVLLLGPQIRAMKGLTLSPGKAPGMLMEASWDQNGDIDRASFLAEIIDRKQKIVETLPKLK